MTEKEFLKQVSASDMPDIAEIKKSCLKELNTDRGEEHRRGHFVRAAVVIAAVVCLCFWSADILSGYFMAGGVEYESMGITSKSTQHADLETAEENNGMSGNAGTAEHNDASKDSKFAIGEEAKSDDLVQHQISGEVISLEQGEEAMITVENGKQYTDVFIAMPGKDWTLEIGKLDGDTPYSFTADVSGDYVIYAGKEQENITGEVVIEYSRKAETDELIPTE